FQIYVIDDSGAKLGTPRLIYQNRALSFGPALSYNGELAVVMTSERAQKPQFSLLAFDLATGNQIAELWDGLETSVGMVGLSPVSGDFRVLAASDRTGFRHPLLWNPRTGERVDLPIGDLMGDILPLDWSSDGQRILLLNVTGAVPQIYVFDLTNNTLTKLNHPGGNYSTMYFAPDGEIFAQWTDSTHPTRLIALDDKIGVLTRTVLAAGDVPPSLPW